MEMLGQMLLSRSRTACGKFAKFAKYTGETLHAGAGTCRTLAMWFDDRWFNEPEMIWKVTDLQLAYGILGILRSGGAQALDASLDLVTE
ncbi:Protein of unknown function [Pyronema omphalodes CBS 100304]|uniref:Uncharacterized protein n=1 Tax=Pyronema omphalodes (strain CBS 100304) TaxID=1076935 RepID=U4LIU8_PYROM|nr:Protein of unknown function [Pyronema omphalodes CBS 100304]